MTDKEKIREEVEKLHGNPYYMMAIKDVLEILDMQEKPVSEELEEAASSFARKDTQGIKNSASFYYIVGDKARIFRAGANWQRQKDEHLIWQTSTANYEKGIEEGKQQMMKDAVETKVEWVVKSALQNKLSDIKGDNMDRVEEIKELLQSIFDANYAMVRINGDFKNGEKLKIIVLKEE